MAPPEPKDQDVVLMCGKTSDGEGVRVLRSRASGEPEAGELRSVKPGEPIQGAELVRLSPRQESPLIWDVHVEYDGRANKSHAGPARVASSAYRRNWDQVFGKDDAEGTDVDEPALN
jgi:hypothetical protein